MPRVNTLMDRMKPYPIGTLTRRREEILARGIPLFDFGLGDPTEPTPAFIRQAIERAIPHTSRYPAVSGTPELRRAIGGYVHRRFGVTLDPDSEILPTSGSKEALFHLPLLVIDRDAPDRTVIYPDPSYPAYERGALFAGGLPFPVQLKGDWSFRPWEIPPSVLETTRILILNSPHNPTGLCMSRENLRRTWELCRAHDILLVSDECYVDLYDDTPPPSILEVAREGVIAVHSLSKRSGMAGYRAGFIAGDPQWIDLLRDFRSNPGLVAQDFVNAAAVAAWSDDSHVAERRVAFSERRRLMMDFLLKAGLNPVPSSATFYLWFPAPTGFDDLSYSSFLSDAGIIVSPGRLFATTPAGEGHLRLALVPSIETCQQAIEVWRSLLPSHQESHR